MLQKVAHITGGIDAVAVGTMDAATVTNGLIWSAGFAGCIGVAIRRGPVAGLAQCFPNTQHTQPLLQRTLKTVIKEGNGRQLDVIITGANGGVSAPDMKTLNTVLAAHCTGLKVTVLNEISTMGFAKMPNGLLLPDFPATRPPNTLDQIGFFALCSQTGRYCVDGQVFNHISHPPRKAVTKKPHRCVMV